jgi:hypothetical protein
MVAHIPKRAAVALPRRFTLHSGGSRFDRRGCHSDGRPPWQLLCLHSHRLEPGSLPSGPVGEASGRSERPRSVCGEANVPHICAAFASPRTSRTRCVAPLELGADAFSVHVNANGRCVTVYVAPLEMPLYTSPAMATTSLCICWQECTYKPG